MAARLEFQGTSKQFGAKTAVDNLSLRVEPGEILGFLGPNGAGKTTAIHLALGFLLPTSGAGMLLDAPFGTARGRTRLGYLPDAPAFFASSAAFQVELAARLSGLPHTDLHRRVKELIGRVRLDASSDARKLSRGMQQRLGLARALINDPDLLILDEPTSALDPASVIEVRELLLAARAQGKSIFFSSHQLAEVEQVCDRIAFLNHGRLVRVGRLHDLLKASGRVEIVARGLNTGTCAAFECERLPDGNIRIFAPDALQREVIERVWMAGGEIVSLTPRRRSLEELFVEWSKEP